MQHNTTLTDLLNANPAAYEFFYALPPHTQTLLQSRDIGTLDQLRQAAADAALEKRPIAF